MNDNQSAVEALPGAVLFQVVIMRELMKTIDTTPLREVIPTLNKMNEQIDLLFAKGSRAQDEQELKTK